MSDYFTVTGDPVAQSRGASAVIRSVISAISAGFDKLPTLLQVWGGKANYGVDTGAANAYVVSIASTYNTSYTDGMTLKVKAVNANTGASTINVNGLGVKSIVRPDGTALQAGDIAAGQIIQLSYTTTAGDFRMMNAYGGPAGTGIVGNASGGVNFLDGGTGSSAATLNPWGAASGNRATITSGTTITAFAAAPQAGADRELIASGALAITASASIAIQGCSSGETLTLATGDILHVRAITTTTFRCTVERAYAPANVTQATSKSTAVTINANRGYITMNNASLATFASVAFTVNNSLVRADDVPLIALADTTAGTTAYSITVENVVAGAFVIQVFNHSPGALAEALRINFRVN